MRFKSQETGTSLYDTLYSQTSFCPVFWRHPLGLDYPKQYGCPAHHHK